MGPNYKRIYPLVLTGEVNEELEALQDEYEDLRRVALNYELEVKKLKEQRLEQLLNEQKRPSLAKTGNLQKLLRLKKTTTKMGAQIMTCANFFPMNTHANSGFLDQKRNSPREQ